MPKKSNFTWRNDYGVRLESAVNHYNRQVTKIKKVSGNIPNMPGRVTYNKIKFSVNSKRELDRVIKSLNSLNAKNRMLVKLPGGIVMTKWQRQQYGKKGFVINQRLAIEHKQIMALEVIGGFEKMGIKNAQMPNVNEAEFRKRNFNPDKVKPQDFDQFAARVEKQYATDYLSKYHEQVQINFYNAVYKTFGSDADDLLKIIDGMDNKKFMRMLNSNTLVDFDYVYRKTDNYDERLETLNKIFDV